MCVTVVFGIIHINGKVLIVNNRDKEGVERWTLPGGKVEAGETLLEALCREVTEETKYSVIETQVAYIHEAFFPKYSAHVRAFVFHTHIDRSTDLLDMTEVRDDPGNSVIGMKWVSNQELSCFIQNEKILYPLKKWLSHLRTSEYYITKDMEW